MRLDLNQDGSAENSQTEKKKEVFPRGGGNVVESGNEKAFAVARIQSRRQGPVQGNFIGSAKIWLLSYRQCRISKGFTHRVINWEFHNATERMDLGDSRREEGLPLLGQLSWE